MSNRAGISRAPPSVIIQILRALDDDDDDLFDDDDGDDGGGGGGDDFFLGCSCRLSIRSMTKSST